MSAQPSRNSAIGAKSSALVARGCRMRGRRVYLEIDERREISFPVTKYATLSDALQVDLKTIHLRDEGRAVAWANLDEVIQVDDVARNIFVHTPRPNPAGLH
jgi:hypothetical protein